MPQLRSASLEFRSMRIAQKYVLVSCVYDCADPSCRVTGKPQKCLSTGLSTWELIKMAFLDDVSLWKRPAGFDGMRCRFGKKQLHLQMKPCGSVTSNPAWSQSNVGLSQSVVGSSQTVVVLMAPLCNLLIQ